jgi:glycine cleavage system aminomethyltransferase T
VARNIKVTPVYPALKEAGGVFGASYGMEYAKYFSLSGSFEDGHVLLFVQ